MVANVHIDFTDNQTIILKNIDINNLSNDNFNLTITNGETAGELQGTESYDFIDGKGGNDVIYLGGGSDEVLGGDGVDSFVISKDSFFFPEFEIIDELMDFNVASEKIFLTDFENITSFDDLEIDYYNNEYQLYDTLEYFALVNLGNNQFIEVYNTNQDIPFNS